MFNHSNTFNNIQHAPIREESSVNLLSDNIWFPLISNLPIARSRSQSAPTMPFLARPPPSLLQCRTFSSTTCQLAKSTKQRLAFEHSAVPTYPYGASQVYKQSNFGLYGRQRIRYGNMVSEKNEIKTRRFWRPNVQLKRLWSDSLGSFVRIRVTTRVLRTIDKCGGLDEYLLGEKAGRVKDLGMGGWKLRWRIMQTEAVRERFRKQREAAGLLEPEALVGSDGTLVSAEQVEEEVRRYDDELERGADVDIGEDAEGAAVDEFMREEPARTDKATL
jgi:large subunit ribosomal protein L28